MKRILFVDDEPQVLGELQRALEPQKAQWEMVFARTGQEALALLGAKPFDAIVSDVSMPEMDGATLLKAVCEKFPGVVRIVLASQPEMASALPSGDQRASRSDTSGVFVILISSPPSLDTANRS